MTRLARGLRTIAGAAGVAILVASCTAQKVRIENVTLTPQGGVVSALDGMVTLTLPPGSVGATRQVPIGTNPIAPEPAPFVSGSAVSLGLPGAKFLKNVILRFSYAGLSLPPGGAAPNLRICKIWNHRWVIQPGSTVDTNAQTVSLAISGGGTFGLVAQASGSVAPEGKAIYRMHLESNFGGDGNPSRTWYRIPLSTPAEGEPRPYWQVSSDYDTLPKSRLAPTENGVFFVRKGEQTSDFYLANLDGSGPVAMTSLGFTNTTGMVLDPNSNQAYFTAQIGGIWRLYKMAAGGAPIALVNLGPLTPSSAPAVQPDGVKVACGFTNGEVRFYRVSDGVLQTTLNTGTEAVGLLLYNNPGNKLAYGRGPYNGSYFNYYRVSYVDVPSMVVHDLNATSGGAVAWDPNGTNWMLVGGPQYDIYFSWTTYGHTTPKRVSDLFWR